MTWFRNIWHGITGRALDVAINEDRAVASALWHDGVNETISGEAGTRPVLEPLKVVLDATLPGGPHGKHSENAAYDDAAQQAALNKAEGTHV